MSEEKQLGISFGSPPTTPDKSHRTKTKKRDGAGRKRHSRKLVFSPNVNNSVTTNNSSNESPVKKQIIDEVVTPRKTQADVEIVHRHRQFEIASPTKAQAAAPPVTTQILNIEEEEIASGADNKVTKITVHYHEVNTPTILVVRQNHKGREPNDSPLADLIQAQHHCLIAKRLAKTSGRDEYGVFVKEYYEYCAGSLTDIPISYTDIPAFFLAIVRGVKVIHSQGCAHLDLKPDNILVGFDGLPKIADLDNLQRLGTISSVTGTKSYMPIEVTAGNSHDRKSGRAIDAWSLGCILYYLYMREAPPLTAGKFAGFTEEMKMRFVSKSPDAFRAINIIEKLLSNDPRERLEMYDRIEDKNLFKGIDKKNLLAHLQHGDAFKEIYNIDKKYAYSEQLFKYQAMRQQCEKIDKHISEKQQRAIEEEAPYAALKLLLRSEELASFKNDELQKAKEEKLVQTQAEMKIFLNNKEVEFLGIHLGNTVKHKKQELYGRIVQLKTEQLEHTKKELDHLVIETKIKIAISTRFKDNEALCKKIIDYNIPDARGSRIPTIEEWEKNFSRMSILVDAFFGVNNKCKYFGLYITRYHSAKTLADKIKWSLNLLSEIQAYPKASQIPVLEDLRKKVIKEIEILHKDHRIIAPEVRQQLELDIPEPVKIPMTPTPKESKAAGQEEQDNLISNTIWLEKSKKFYLPWHYFEATRKDVKILDGLVSEYSKITDAAARFKYARDIIITAEQWLTVHKSSMRYEAVEELQRCAIYTLNSLLRSLKMNENDMAALLAESLVRPTENVDEQISHKKNRSRLFACFRISKETVDLPTEVAPQ